MALIKGISYNFKGLSFGLKTPSLLMLGLARLVVILFFTIITIGLVLSKYQDIMNMIWTHPESLWFQWLWYVASWLLALILAAISTLLAFLISQILFSIIIMDYMSRITERKSTGKEIVPSNLSFWSNFIFLFKQEIPRATIPIAISVGLMIVSWLTPLSPILTILSPIAASTFLAWDNTDLVPARRLEPFRNRFQFLRKHLSFHVGFGVCFLIPGLNILLLSFAPVGATLFHIEHIDKIGTGAIGSVE